ncbi:protein ANTI-SILENCING 1 isoform X2 [Vigna angularis]|uniref:protein ANTI-SILENCING 1 isoform X2 n=1 Tax=Phaseolus angularis TaxID=3914 RepID=UPI0022B33657|nr:protein ANTI-SILENCING 1 isoform X2 [Vigna angularis]
MVEAGEEVIEFKWGNMRSVGGRKKDVRFYDSFFYDGVEYSLFDSVFLYKEGEPEHYIGKIVKIWETSDKNKRVKVLWYFRPSEIGNFLEGSDALENELFLASGEGEGLANVNPLEAIAGKCNIVCISKDSRNPYPSDAEVKMAEFVFYRFFDVGKCKILDKIDDKIAGIEVKNIFNNLDSRKHVGIVKPGLEKKEVSGNFMACNEAVTPLSQNNSQPLIEKPDGKYFDALAREHAVSKSLLGKKPTLRTGVKEASELNDSLHLVSNNKNAPQDKVEEKGGHKASLVKQKSFSKLSHGPRTDLKMREMAKMDNGRGNDSIEKNISTSRVNLGNDHEDGGVSVGQFNKGVVEEMTSKKENRGGFDKVSSAKMNNNGKSRKLITYDDDDDNGDDVKTVAPSSSKDKYKLQREVDSFDVEELPSKRLKIDKTTKLTGDKLCKDSSMISLNVEHERDFRPTEVTRRPDDDRRKWFKEIPWEEKLKTAFEQRKLVLLQNLDPSLSSSENIIWTGFKERCTAKVIQKNDYTSPHSGQAFAIFKKMETAAKVVRELDEGCFLLSNGLPLVGSFGIPVFPEKKPVFYGHHVVDQLRMMQMQREMRDAVSTSHCSQPNNIEYDMAIEWCLLQERANKSWRMLYKQQGEQLRKLKAKLKSKT